MNDDVRKFTYATILLFLAIVVTWLSILYLNACGLTVDCKRALPKVDRTPIPTLIPATLPAANQNRRTEFNKCQIAAADLIGAWVNAGRPEGDAFPFVDVTGATCEGTYLEDVQPLFTSSNLWYAGALACSSCHDAALLETNAGLDLSSYQAMSMGSRRTGESIQGNDIFGDGNWDGSVLRDWLVVQQHIPLARPPELPSAGPVIYAGNQVTVAQTAPTPTP